MDVLGDIAGIYGFLCSGVGILFFTISKQSFILSAMKKLYLVKSKYSHIFDKKKSSRHAHNFRGIQKYLGPKVFDLVSDE